ncbi:HEAT repeat domain-containing protein [Paenibacillus sp. UNC451MF]|uniref:HEAT repeat domain-containing protein n=1 Tax=Paenibacillus sp. UNC451MF TaxID=1449063 RepID=UPI00068F9AF4|nr:HEAT repeat domain-containing protein [Paenibacillus sp. UNC451MF]
MSLNVLFELQHEVRRLFIAGSTVAAGDMRLQKMIPQLHQLSESVPVFGRVAQAVTQVVEADSGESASKLLELGTLLNSMLYTLGRTESKEEIFPVKGTDAGLSTSLPYRKLSPLIQALTVKGQGRLDQLRQGYEEGLFQDFRSILPSLAALDDSYSEIPDFIQRKVLPAYGKEALPALLQQFKLDGGKGDGRRLEQIHVLLRGEGLGIIGQAAREGSIVVRAAAIELLGDYPEQIDYILEQADDKKKEICSAALFALARLGSEQAVERLYKALVSKDRELVIEPIQRCQANSLTQKVIAHAESALERIVLETSIEETALQLLTDIHCLQGKRELEVVHLLQRLLSTPAFIKRDTEAAQEAAVELLLDIDLPEADEFAVSLQDAYAGKFIDYSFKAAVKILSPQEVYDRFHSHFKNKKQSTAKTLLRAFHEETLPYQHRLGNEPIRAEAKETTVWDPRWVQLFVELDEADLVCRLVEAADAKVIAYLRAKCEAQPHFNKGQTSNMLLVLFGMQEPSAPQLLMDILEKGGDKQYYYLDRVQLTLLSLLPKSYAERLRQYAEKLTYQNLKDQLLDIAETIAAKTDGEKVTEIEEKGQGLWGWIRSKMS